MTAAAQRRILITGGTSGIGAAMARTAAAAGHSVFVTGRDHERLRQLRDSAPGVHGAVAHAGEWEATENAVTMAVERLGGLDVVVANAGFSARGDLVEGDPEQWRDMVLTNVLGPALLMKASAPYLLDSRGQIVILGSTSGRKVFAGNLYSATKWAVTGYAESLRQQLAGSGITVSLLAPGQVRTDLWDEARNQWIESEEIAEVFLWLISRPRSIDISEVVVRAAGQDF